MLANDYFPFFFPLSPTSLKVLFFGGGGGGGLGAAFFFSLSLII